jgi:ParB-like chromosome segregation protein Spo0J
MPSSSRRAGDTTETLPTLTDPSQIRASTYNPRTTDPARLKLIELSLQKLGFIIPIYATRSGEVISGHQRLLVAEGWGLGTVPVVRVPDLPEQTRRGINIAFNRATNDMAARDTPRVGL